MWLLASGTWCCLGGFGPVVLIVVVVVVVLDCFCVLGFLACWFVALFVHLVLLLFWIWVLPDDC